MNKTAAIILQFIAVSTALALESNEIAIIANSDIPESVSIAKYYCSKRGVPAANIIELALGKDNNSSLSRADYEKKLARPIREKLSAKEFDSKIKCLVTTFGVPFKVGPRDLPPAEQTSASVDSELSMVLLGAYDLYRWQNNNLKANGGFAETRTIMVSRLDGPGENIAKGLVDKALAAENNGLDGTVYVDSRGLAYNSVRHSFGYYDQSLRDLALLARFRTNMPVNLEGTEELFKPGQCPRTAVYCGWYSVRNYIDAFDFVDGAIGFHIASFEAVDLRDANSGQWCPAMLHDGITATLGAVDEPYLNAFPEPKAFFLELFNGRCLVEAFYRTNPFNSWQMVLIGDPLYTPFKKR